MQDIEEHPDAWFGEFNLFTRSDTIKLSIFAVVAIALFPVIWIAGKLGKLR